MVVSIPEPFDFARTVERIAALGPDRVNGLAEGGLVRAISGRAVVARPVAGGVTVEPRGAAEASMFRHILGAGFAVDSFEQHVAADAVIARLTRALRGLRPFLVPDPFEMLVTSITAQQISLHAALAVRNRIVERFGEPCGPVYMFPSPDSMADASVAELRELGLSRSKARFVVEIARSELDFGTLAALSDADVVDALTALPGVGRWTAEWFLARHLGRGDVWPAGDLGVRRALERFYTDGEPVDESAARQLGERFAPYRTLACAYLLAGLRLG